MNLANLAATCRARPDDELAHHNLARQAIVEGDDAQAVGLLERFATSHPNDARGWQWLALLHRTLDQRRPAIEAMARARDAAPDDASIAQGMARISLEAGRPAVAAHLDAIRIAPGDTSARLGLASARLAMGDGEAALVELGLLLEANPGWLEGHRAFGQLAAQVGSPDPLASLEQALKRFPDSGDLHEALISALSMAEQHTAVLERTEDAIVRFGAVTPFTWHRASALDELGESEAAAVAFDQATPAITAGQAVLRIRHLLRRGHIELASSEIHPWLDGVDARLMWPYAHIAWRLLEDPRASWLDDDGQLIAEVDLGMTEDELDETSTLLRALHRGAGRFLDQSVRLGTQTDGPLLARIEPPIERLRERLRGATCEYIRSLPQNRDGHPLLAARRDSRPRFAGSWSVRLTGRGHHAPHHHPEGWISSAFYLVVPKAGAEESGMLEIGGAPADLGVALAPLRRIVPAAGKLVLFPSTMWHSTTPFPIGERISVAFDIARP